MHKTQIAMRSDVQELKEGLQTLEKKFDTYQKNIVDSTGIYTDTIIHYIDNQTSALNKRLYNVETDIEKLYRQKEV